MMQDDTANGGLASDTGSERRRPVALVGAAVIVLALAIAAASFAILLGLTPLTPDEHVTLTVIVINSAIIGLLALMIGREVARILVARRRGRAASRLHVRIVTMFALVAAIPAIMVAVVASVSLDIGLDRWFQIRTKVIINSSLSIAEAYVQENARNLRGTTLSMAYDLDQGRMVYNLDRTGFRDFLTQETQGRGLDNAVLMKPDGSLVMTADMPHPHQMPNLQMKTIQQAESGEPVLIQPGAGNIVGTIIKLHEIPNMLLYTIKELDPEVIRARQIVRANTNEYRGLEANRMTTQVAFALVYIGITLIIVLSAIWTGITVADRLVRPIRQLIGAADEVATGNLDVSVPVRPSDGDVGLARRHLQPDDPSAQVAAQRARQRQGRHRRAPALLRGRAGRRDGRRHRRRPRRHHLDRQPVGRNHADDHRATRPSARTCRPCCRRSAACSRSAARPSGRSIATRSPSTAAAPSAPSTCRSPSRRASTRRECAPTSSRSTTSPTWCRRSAPPPGPTSRAASPTRSRTR